MKCLIIDDEQNMLNLFQRWFRYLKHSMDVALNGKEALALIKKSEYDFVITDIMMPVMDGVEFVKAALELKPSLFIILMTGQASQKMIDSALKSGSVICMRKPFSFEEIQKKIVFIQKSIERKKYEKNVHNEYENLPLILKMWKRYKIKENLKIIVYVISFSIIIGWFIVTYIKTDVSETKEKPKNEMKQFFKMMKKMQSAPPMPLMQNKEK